MFSSQALDNLTFVSSITTLVRVTDWYRKAITRTSQRKHVNDDTNIELRLPCTSVEPYEFGDYTVFGHLPRPDSAPALFAASLAAQEKMQILVRLHAQEQSWTFTT